MAITDKLTEIANAIRSKNGTTNTMTLDEMSNAITNIQTGMITSDNRCTTIPDYLFYGCEKLALTELPSGVTSIGISAFENCPNLAITELPSGVTSIGDSAFSGCAKLALTELPSGITSIGHGAFENCTGIHSLTFKGTPNTIAPIAFIGCDNLTTINVPWAEGAVENAPWGATNATINYNYVAV